MYRHGETKVLLLAVEVVEVVSPQVLHVARVHPPVAVGRFLNEHHRREVVQVPVRGDFYKARLRTGFEGVHPVGRVFTVVDGGDGVAGSEVVGVTVLVGEGVVFGCLVSGERGLEVVLRRGYVPTVFNAVF